MKRGSVSMILVIAAIAAIIYAGGCIGSPAVEENETHLIYSGAELKDPMSEIGKLFGKKNGVTVELTYGGSGVLISQMETSHLGDAFIPGGQSDYQNAIKKGLVVNSSQPVAYHVPIIAVQKGNPLDITKVADLAKPGIHLALGDVNATSIGKADAALLTMDNAKGDKFDLIEIPVTNNSILIAPIGITSFTKQPELAQKFADFTASAEGKAIFAK